MPSTDNTVKRRVLVVDDERAYLTIVSMTLSEEGYDINVAKNGETALKICRSDNPPDVVLLDINMPEMDGYEVCSALKADAATRDIPVIFLTARNEEGDEERGIELGAVDYLVKPFSVPLLKARVATHSQRPQAVAASANSGPLSIGDTLLQAGLISRADLDRGLAEQQENPGLRLGEILIEKRIVNEDDMTRIIAERFGLEFVDLTKTEPDPAAFSELPARLVREFNALPIATDEETVTVAMADPLSGDALEAIRFASKKRVITVAVSPSRVGRIIADGGAAHESDTEFDAFVAGLMRDRETDVDEMEADPELQGAMRLVNRIILDAIKQNASDIHFESGGEFERMIVRFRRDGTLSDYRSIPPAYKDQMIARLKIMGRMDTANRRAFQDGKVRFRAGNADRDLRLVSLPTAEENEDVVMRILERESAFPLNLLALSDKNLAQLTTLIEQPYGMILAVGPTGSGKTTTLHAMIGHINTRERKIWTIEDPVEIRQPGLRQLQVVREVDVTFQSAMRSFLRADPDVIMVGEMRDVETASMAIEASLTGHLLLSTLHTNSAPETITRLTDMGMEPFAFSDALLGILAQRLVKRLCGKCREDYAASDAEREEFVRYLGEARLSKLTGSEGLRLSRAPGCQDCEYTGYVGRVALHELLVVNDEIRQAIQERDSAAAVRTLAQAAGMVTLIEDGAIKCLDGLTDIAQVVSVCGT